MKGFTGQESLEAAVTGAQLVIIPAGVPRKPGMTPKLRLSGTAEPTLGADQLAPAQVKGFTGQESLEAAVTGAQLVIIPAGVPRKPGMTRDDLFNINASIVKALVEACAKAAPDVSFFCCLWALIQSETPARACDDPFNINASIVKARVEVCATAAAASFCKSAGQLSHRQQI